MKRTEIVKINKLLYMIIVTFVLTCIMTSCKCEHEIVIDSAIDATCTQEGLTEGAHCNLCNEVLVIPETIPAKGHRESKNESIEATCTETGLTEGTYCSVCDEILVAQEVIPANGHTEVIREGKEATCTDTGLTKGTDCSVCGEVLIAQETILAKGHTEVIKARKEATCTATGLTEGKDCSVCGAVLKAQKTIAAKGHTEAVRAGKKATCTTTGLTEGKDCSVCGEILSAQVEIAAMGHKWKSATCTTPRTCSICNKTEGSSNGHKWKSATCTAPKTCSICKKTEGSIGNHKDSGNGMCSYCKQNIVFIELWNGFNVELIIPTVGGMNGYCTVKYTNNTQYTISGDMCFLCANGKLLYNPSPEFTIKPGYYATVTHYIAIVPSERYDQKHKTLYLDNNSLAYTNVQVNGQKVFVKFGISGPVAYGYSLADIGVY